MRTDSTSEIAKARAKAAILKALRELDDSISERTLLTYIINHIDNRVDMISMSNALSELISEGSIGCIERTTVYYHEN